MVEAFSWSPDGSMLAAGDYDFKVYVFVSLALVRAVLRRRLYALEGLLDLA